MNKRSDTFEQMRIIALFMIILGHCVLATGQNTDPLLGSLDNIGWSIKAFTICGVNLFFLLSGYFARSDHFRFGKVAGIWFKTVFYSVAVYILILLTGSSLSIRDGISFLFPVFTGKYWFMQVYIVLALIAPFIALGLEKLSNRKLNVLVAILIVFFSLHETFVKVAMTLDQTQGYGFIWGCVMFIVGYWLHRNIGVICRFKTALYMICYFVISICIFVSNYVIVKYNIAGGVSSRGNFYAYDSITVFIQSVSLFCFFAKLAEENKKSFGGGIIGFFSRNTLAGYLISAHPLLLYPLWTKYLKMDHYARNPALYLVFAVVLSIAVLIACIMIDKALDWVLKKMKTERIFGGIDEFFSKMVNA